MNRVHVVATSHGTDNLNGQQQINRLREQLQTAASGLNGGELVVHEAYVDVQQPELGSVLDGLPVGEPAVVLPLLVADGVHTTSDIAGAVRNREATIAAAPLAGVEQLAEVLADRARALLDDVEYVVLAAAGTRLRLGQQQLETLRDQVAELLGRDLTLAYCAGAEPRVDSLVESFGAEKTLVISALLAEGYFQDKLTASGAKHVTRPLLPDDMIAKCFVGRLERTLEEMPAYDEE